MIAQSVAEVLSDHVGLTGEGIDRVYLNVYVPRLQSPEGAASFFRHRGRPLASSALMRPMSRRFVAALDRFIAQHELPLVLFCKGQRKDDVMAERLRSFAAEVGLVFVDKAQEKASVFRTAKRYNPGSGRSYPWLVKSTAMVNHYYTRRRRPRLRPVLSQVLYLFPYTAKLCLNGHEYAKRQLAGDGIAFQALDNGVQNCADPHRLQQICDGLSAETIEGLLREWLDRLPHHRPVHRRLFFEQVIRENLDLGRPEQVQLIFNRKITRATPGRFRTRVRQIRSSNLTYSQNIP